MKFRTFRILLSRGWTKLLYTVSLFVFSMLSVDSRAQTVSDSIDLKTENQNEAIDEEMKRIIDSTLAAMLPIIREDRYQGMRARAYGPLYPTDEKPLIILDGNVINVDSYKRADFDFDKDSFSKKKVAGLLDIKPKQIKSITFLKDEAATKIWGSRGTNGVLEVITEKQRQK
jgi:hypothetical protein